MNILLTSTAYPPSTGGAQLLQHQTALQLKARHSIQVVSQWDRNRTDWLTGSTIMAPRRSMDYMIDGVSVHRFGLGLSERSLLLPFVVGYYACMRVANPIIAHYLERHIDAFARRADLVHNMRIGREPLSYASFFAARKHGIPFVFTPVHHPKWSGWRYREFISLYREADALLALTKAEKRTLNELGVAEHKIHVIGMGPNLAPEADAERFRTLHNIRGPFVLFVGQHYPYKGYRQLLGAAKFVWKRVPEAEFVFIGPAVGSSERAFSDSPDRRVHRLGKVDLQEKTDALAACALLCVPSTQESFGGVYAEAWHFAKPVIGCAIPAVSEVVTHGTDGLLLKQNPLEIAEAICELLLNSGRSQQMGEAGQSKVRQNYTWQQIGGRVEAAYTATLRGSNYTVSQSLAEGLNRL